MKSSETIQRMEEGETKENDEGGKFNHNIFDIL
jgi:hypothetical protein